MRIIRWKRLTLPAYVINVWNRWSDTYLLRIIISCILFYNTFVAPVMSSGWVTQINSFWLISFYWSEEKIEAFSFVTYSLIESHHDVTLLKSIFYRLSLNKSSFDNTLYKKWIGINMKMISFSWYKTLIDSLQ